MRLFAYHENPESVAALLDALSRRVEVHAVRVMSPMAYMRLRRGRGAGFYWAEVAGAEHQGVTVVPGLRRFERISKAMLDRSYRAAVKHHGQPDFVLIDSPYLAPWATDLEAPLVYLGTDPYRFYTWPTETTESFERQILSRARLALPVSELLADEFEAAGARRVLRLPNGVGPGFADRARGRMPVPLDLAAIPGPRVLVVGMINATYDWNLIAALAEARPEVSYVFIGPLRETDERQRSQIEQVFARPNVHWLGPRPHDELPAYLSGSEVLLNPLAINDHNDRRYPLRLCEYLTTDRPILTTAIHEAKWFAPHVVPFNDPSGAVAALDAAIAGETEIDSVGRRRWLDENSWDARASTILEALQATTAEPK